MAPSDDNQSIYEDASVIGIYRSASPPQQAELNMFEPLSGELKVGRLLDIGIGAGRTTAYLAPKVGHYVGVDYSHGLVKAPQQLYPEAEILWCDARDMSQFEDGSFDFVNFSFNGLDSLDHDGRLQVLAEVRRVLKPGGHWMFSSHNRDYDRRGLLPWQPPFKPGRVMLKKSTEASATPPELAAPAQGAGRDAGLRIGQRRGAQLLAAALLRLPRAQIAQLEAAGFTDVRVFDQWGEGRRTGPAESIWLYYDSRRG